jgi:putative aldouronate transport system permease protein
LTAPFVGLKHFEVLWQDFTNQGRFFLAMRNTLAMSFLQVFFGFVLPVTFALFLNEIRSITFKKVTT